MTITSVAQAGAARKWRVPMSGTYLTHTTPERHVLKGLHSGALNIFGGSKGSPANFGAGGTLFSKASAGFYNYPDPGAGESVHLYKIKGSMTGGSVPVLVELVDIVWAAVGFSGNTVAAQNVVGFPAYTRGDANGENLDLYLFTVSAAGATSITATVGYTNTAGTAGRNAVKLLEASALTNPLTYLIPRQGGDSGIKSIQSLTFSGATGAAGNIGLALVRSLGFFIGNPMGGGAGAFNQIDADWTTLGLPRLEDAALSTIGHGNNSSATVQGNLSLVYG